MNVIKGTLDKLPIPVQFAIVSVAYGTGLVLLGKVYNIYSAIAMSKYRDKSALYGRELKPGEPPSWP